MLSTGANSSSTNLPLVSSSQFCCISCSNQRAICLLLCVRKFCRSCLHGYHSRFLHTGVFLLLIAVFSIRVPNTGSTLGLGVGDSGITGSQLSDGFLVEASL